MLLDREVLYNDGLSMFSESFAKLWRTEPRIAHNFLNAACACTLQPQQNQTGKSAVVYHEPSRDQRFTPQRGERLLEDGDGSAVFEWVFFVAEPGSDFGLLGWYHKVEDVFDLRPRRVQTRM